MPNPIGRERPSALIRQLKVLFTARFYNLRDKFGASMPNITVIQIGPFGLYWSRGERPLKTLVASFYRGANEPVNWPIITALSLGPVVDLNLK